MWYIKISNYGETMSGHSKWATTKHQKFAADAKRGATFTKVANMITVAAREGGDPEFNFKLRLAVEKAKSVSMPKDNIDRAIARGTGKGEGANTVEEIVYEAYGPGSTAILITALTDNKMRAFSDIRTVLNKYGGRLAEGGSVAYQFEHKGVVIVSHQLDQDEEVQLAAIDLGAEDVESDGELTRVITLKSDLQKVRQGLLEAGYVVEEARLEWQPKMTHEVSAEDQEKLTRLLEALEDLDDVSDLATNVSE